MRERKTEGGRDREEGAGQGPPSILGALAALDSPRIEGERLRAAVHLAGHVVAAEVCGLEPQALSLEPVAGCTFLPSAGAAPRGPARTATEAAIITTLAGVEAERLASTPPGMESCRAGVAGLLTDGDPREAEPYLEWLRLKAERLVEHPLRQRIIAALALALIARGQLSAAEVEVLRRAEISRYMRGQ